MYVMCTMCMPGNLLDQKKGIESLELELWMVMRPHVGIGN